MLENEKKTTRKRTTKKATSTRKAAAEKKTPKKTTKKTATAKSAVKSASRGGKTAGSAKARATRSAPKKPAATRTTTVAETAPATSLATRRQSRVAVPERARRVETSSTRRLSITAVERERMIAETAYYKSQQRGPFDADQHQDWFEAEAEVDARLVALQSGDD